MWCGRFGRTTLHLRGTCAYLPKIKLSPFGATTDKIAMIHGGEQDMCQDKREGNGDRSIFRILYIMETENKSVPFSYFAFAMTSASSSGLSAP